MTSEQQELLSELLTNMMETTPDLEDNKNYGQEDLDRLKLAGENFLKKEEFEVGQIVKWKTDLKNRKLPRRHQPAIVVSILDEPITNPNDESGSPYFLEPLDIVLGVITDDDNFLTFYYDSRRFEPYST